MPRKFRILLILIAVTGLAWLTWRLLSDHKQNIHPRFETGQAVDSFNGVMVYYNGHVGHTSGRNRTRDGYNLGMKYQCVEFVKRYYYGFYRHKMPDSYGNAVDFFDARTPKGKINRKRGLLQFRNGQGEPPRPGDIIVLDATGSNPYGHVAIITRVTEQSVEIIQQNPGPFGSSREKFTVSGNGTWRINNDRVLGWLRKP